jgi:hypothetical protein
LFQAILETSVTKFSAKLTLSFEVENKLFISFQKTSKTKFGSIHFSIAFFIRTGFLIASGFSLFIFEICS